MEPTRKRIVYQDFTGGDHGDIESRLAEPNQFHAKNMVVYRDGAMGPRNGLVPVKMSGSNYVNGALNMFYLGIGNELGVLRMFYGQGDTPRTFEAETSATQNPGVFGPGTPETWDVVPVGQPGVLQRLGFLSYVAVLGDGLYKIDGLATTITKIADAPGGRDVVEYLDQLYVVGTGESATANFVGYSANNDPDTWPVENIFPVGQAWVVFSGLKFQNGLLFATQDQRWWLLSGTPVSGSLRSVAYGRGPNVNAPRSIIFSRDVAWFIAGLGTSDASPANFDGSQLNTDPYTHLRWLSAVEHAGGLFLYPDNDIAWFGNDTHRAIFRHHGVWTLHDYEVDVSEFAAEVSGSRYIVAVDGDETHKPVFYRSKQDLIRPAIYDGIWESPGDGSRVPFDAFVEFPEFFAEDGSLVRPRAIFVEFTSYADAATDDDGDAVVPSFSVEAKVIQRLTPTPTRTLQSQDWTEADDEVTPSTEDGVRRRFVYRPEKSDFGAGMQVRLFNVQGVKFERIVAEYEEKPDLDRA